MMLDGKYLTVFAISIIFLLLSSGCATHGNVIFESKEGKVVIESYGEEASYDQDQLYPKEEINIPKGHMPPPGKCRIWFPGRPPGHQPPPGDCEHLRNQVPPGAWLIRG